MRTMFIALSLALLTGCGGEPKDVACCDIEPKARCQSDLLKAGLSREEVAMVTGSPDGACLSARLPEAALRALAAAWPETCRSTYGPSPLAAPEDARCAASETSSRDDTPPAGVDPAIAAACAAGLRARGLTDTELWLVLHEPQGVCPNAGVNEARLRAIIAKDWDAAGCSQFSKDEMLHALDSGACGGDAG